MRQNRTQVLEAQNDTLRAENADLKAAALAAENAELKNSVATLSAKTASEIAYASMIRRRAERMAKSGDPYGAIILLKKIGE